MTQYMQSEGGGLEYPALPDVFQGALHEFADDRDVGAVKNGQHLTSAIDFYVLNTTVPLSMDDFELDDTGRDLIRISEIIQIQAQAVVTGLHVMAATAAEMTAMGLTPVTPGTTVYRLKFQIEHTGAWIVPMGPDPVNGAMVPTAGFVPQALVPAVAGSTLAFALQNETTLCPLPTSGATLTMGGNSSLWFSPIL